jgi:hypothetical protein
MHFPGIIPAVITPFTPADTVDVAGLQANTAHVLEHGAAGLVATGTMGEAGQLSAGERRTVIEAVVAQADGTVPVLAGVSAGSTAAAVANAELSRAAGVAGVMCLPPLNYRGARRTSTSPSSPRWRPRGCPSWPTTTPRRAASTSPRPSSPRWPTPSRASLRSRSAPATRAASPRS